MEQEETGKAANDLEKGESSCWQETNKDVYVTDVDQGYHKQIYVVDICYGPQTKEDVYQDLRILPLEQFVSLLILEDEHVNNHEERVN